MKDFIGLFKYMNKPSINHSHTSVSHILTSYKFVCVPQFTDFVIYNFVSDTMKCFQDGTVNKNNIIYVIQEIHKVLKQ